MTDQEYRKRAKKEYAKNGEIEIDENAKVSRGSDPGAYVQAWVWVYNDTYGREESEGGEVGSEDEEGQ